MARASIGISSYKSARLLEKTVDSIRGKSTNLEEIVIFHNPAPGDQECVETLHRLVAQGKVNAIHLSTENVGYAGAVSWLMKRHIENMGAGGVDWSHFIYCDNDIEILTPGWDKQLTDLADENKELGLIFPNSGAYPIRRAKYIEVMWGVGFCFLATRKVITEVGSLDTQIGHQEEADYSLRVRMAGYKLACLPSVQINHNCTATSDPASQERINKGVIRFVDKWNQYFCGKTQGYHSPNVLRWEDWPPNALYMEEYWKLQIPNLNDDPEVRTLDGREYDLIRVPRFKNFYRGRII